MKKLSGLLPLSILLLIPVLYIENNLDGSFITVFNIVTHHGIFAIFKEMLHTSLQPLILTLALFFFVKEVAPKMSLFLGSILLILFFHLFFPAAIFFENIPIFLFIPALHKNNQNYSSHLFFSLFYIVVLALFSSFRIFYLFYGYNIFQLSLLAAPITMLLLLSKRDIYPSKYTLLLLFPLTLLPLCLFLHKPSSISFSHLWSLLFVNLAIICLLSKKRPKLSTIATFVTLLSFTIIDKHMYSTAIFTIISLALSNKKITKAPKEPFSQKNYGQMPSFNFYNKLILSTDKSRMR